MDDQTIAQKLHALTGEFTSGLPDQLGALEAVWTRIWRNGWEDSSLDNLINLTHSLAGTAGSLGFNLINQSANELHAVLQNHGNEDTCGQACMQQVEIAFQALRNAIRTDRQIQMDELIGKLDSAKATSANLQEKRASRLIYMVDDDPIQIADLAAQVGYFGYAVQIFNNLSDLEQAIQKTRPTALLMDISFPEGRMAGYDLIEEMRKKITDLPPVVFISVHDSINFRLQAVRVGGKAYFTKPVDVGNLVDVLDRLIFQDAISPYRVLIVEDSRVQAAYMTVQLNNAGIATEVVANPLQVIDHLITFDPDLLLLDMYMPDCTGIELAQIIRQMEQFISIPIVFLSAETDRDKQLAAMGIGADDFLTKPIEPEHLIAAVTTRIERYRKLRSLMIHDGLTGLLNHSTTKERLIQEVERARRQNEPLAFAMLDLDHFKQVNDTLGHPTGDRVLKSLAQMLHQRLRSSDTIGRFGGDEFAVILPNTDEKDAAGIMKELCDGFARVTHHAGDQEFKVTFSCGVAIFPNFNQVGTLSEAADVALYAAKAAGRNHVITASECGALEFSSAPSQGARTRLAGLSHPAIYLSAINHISQTMMNQQNLQDAVAMVSQEVVSLFKAQHVGIGLLTQDRTTLEFIGNSQTGWNVVQDKPNLVYLPDEPASGQVVQNGKAIFVPDAMHNPLLAETRSIMKEHQVNGRAIIPLIVGGKVIGTMNIDFTDPQRAFNESELELAETIAGSVSGMIEIGRLFNAEQRQRQFFEALVENIPVAVEMIDLDARIQSWNPAAEALFGYTPIEAIGRNIDELLSSEETRNEAVGFTQKSMREGELIHAITKRRRKEGNLVEVELFAVPLHKDGKLLGSLAIYHDISELQRARREAEAANEAKSSFLATMSHEIRTPLNAIVGMTTLLLDTQLSEQQLDYTETIRSSSDALLTIINDILDFSKIEAGRMELEEQPFDLRECIESAFDLVATRATEKGIDLAYLLDPSVPSFVISDSTRLRQILLNLLSNSLKFTNEGEIVLSVSIETFTASTDGSIRLHFAVRDTGIGIPDERKDRLFRSFSQVDASTTRKYGGTGLGLAISKRLSELMGGTMWVESEGIPGKGSTFHFIILVRRSTNPVPVFLNARQPELSGRRALIVDDNATNLYILLRQVQSWGMIPEETQDPLQALTWIKEGRKYDVALLDMQMPEMDGVTLAAEIQLVNAQRTSLPLVMLSSLGIKHTGNEDVKFAAYLTKPIKPAVLYTTLLGVLSPQRVELKVKQQNRPAEPVLGPNSSLRILLAEDMTVNQKVALLLLERIGYRADVVSNGLEVLEALNRQEYDVIFMDVQMPEMDGLEATRAVRSAARQNSSKKGNIVLQPYIIAMTANAMQGDRESCLAAGMDDYISKPIQVEELTQALQRADQARLTGKPKVELTKKFGAPAIDDEAFHKFQASLGAENQSMLASLLVDFLTEGEQVASAIHAAVLNRNSESIWKAAHSLKSSSQMFGALNLAQTCRDLEIKAREGDLESVEGLIDKFDLDFAAVQKVFQG